MVVLALLGTVITTIWRRSAIERWFTVLITTIWRQSAAGWRLCPSGGRDRWRPSLAGLW